MKELIIATCLIGIAMVGLAVGRLLGGRCLRRGCAGTSSEHGEEKACPTCGRNGEKGAGEHRPAP